MVSTYKESAGQAVILVGAGMLHKLVYRMKYRLNHTSEIHAPVSRCTQVNANQDSDTPEAEVRSSQFVPKALIYLCKKSLMQHIPVFVCITVCGQVLESFNYKEAEA